MVNRKRITYALTVILLIALGLSSRKFGSYLPVFIADHSGDMLWAAMVYVGFRFLFLHKGKTWAFAGSIVFSFLIEFSQLYQADWIKSVRNTTVGALVLGHGFLVIDLLRYLLGIAASFLIDVLTMRRKDEKKARA